MSEEVNALMTFGFYSSTLSLLIYKPEIGLEIAGKLEREIHWSSTAATTTQLVRSWISCF